MIKALQFVSVSGVSCHAELFHFLEAFCSTPRLRTGKRFLEMCGWSMHTKLPHLPCGEHYLGGRSGHGCECMGVWCDLQGSIDKFANSNEKLCIYVNFDVVVEACPLAESILHVLSFCLWGSCNKLRITRLAQSGRRTGPLGLSEVL